MNRNDNHASKTDQCRSKSMETIYKNAVKKQISLSSEDCVDISNENLNIELFLDERSGNMEQPRQQHPILIT